MSITGIAGSLISILTGAQANQSNSAQQFEGELQKLGQDLQSGNLPSAQQDFSALQLGARQAIQQLAAHYRHFHAGAAPSPAGAPPAASVDVDFRQLAQSLQSGNLQAAQQAFSAIQADLSRIGSSASSEPPAWSGVPGVSVTI